MKTGWLIKNEMHGHENSMMVHKYSRVEAKNLTRVC